MAPSPNDIPSALLGPSLFDNHPKRIALEKVAALRQGNSASDKSRVYLIDLGVRVHEKFVKVHFKHGSALCQEDRAMQTKAMLSTFTWTWKYLTERACL
jgi:hypothetical protein